MFKPSYFVDAIFFIYDRRFLNFDKKKHNVTGGDSYFNISNVGGEGPCRP